MSLRVTNFGLIVGAERRDLFVPFFLRGVLAGFRQRTDNCRLLFADEVPSCT